MIKKKNQRFNGVLQWKLSELDFPILWFIDINHLALQDKKSTQS